MNLEQFVKRHQPLLVAMESFDAVDQDILFLDVSAEAFELLSDSILQNLAFAASLEDYACAYAAAGEFTQASLEHYELGLRAMLRAQGVNYHAALVPSLEDANEVAPVEGEAKAAPGAAAKAVEMAKKAVAYVIEHLKVLFEKAKAWFTKSRATDKLIQIQAEKAVGLLQHIKETVVQPSGGAAKAPPAEPAEEGEAAPAAPEPAKEEEPGRVSAPRWMVQSGHFNLPMIVQSLKDHFSMKTFLGNPSMFSKCHVGVDNHEQISMTGGIMYNGQQLGSPDLASKTLKGFHDQTMEWASTEFGDAKAELEPVGEQQKTVLVSMAQKTEQLNAQRLQAFDIFEKDFVRMVDEFNDLAKKQGASGEGVGRDANALMGLLNNAFTWYGAEDTAARKLIVSVLKALKPFADQGVTQAAV